MAQDLTAPRSESPVRYALNLQLQAVAETDRISHVERSAPAVPATGATGGLKGFMHSLASRLRGRRS